ncbi:hypothetical protein AA309_23825 [Microvirga vignae]|uniref:Uncharacterized protein n=1 Tax=Microvirga vignae TaxID=1225564 RepID=A0A0H1RDQ6_9HYPH|nr:hypothetical protein AA309_23825 [Microvirga vignae]
MLDGQKNAEAKWSFRTVVYAMKSSAVMLSCCSGKGSGGHIRPRIESVPTRPHELIAKGDAEAAFQLIGQGLETIQRMRDVAPVLLDDAGPDFPLTADVPATRTARSGGNLSAINGHKTKVSSRHIGLLWDTAD